MYPYSRLSPQPPQIHSRLRSLGLPLLEHPQEDSWPSRQARPSEYTTPAAVIACTNAVSLLPVYTHTHAHKIYLYIYISHLPYNIYTGIYSKAMIFFFIASFAKSQFMLRKRERWISSRWYIAKNLLTLLHCVCLSAHAQIYRAIFTGSEKSYNIFLESCVIYRQSIIHYTASDVKKKNRLLLHSL